MGVQLCRSTYQMQTIFWIRSSFSGSLKSFHLDYHHLGPHNRGRYHSDSGKSPSNESHPFLFLWSPDSLGGLSALCFGILVLPFAEQHMKLRVCTPPPPPPSVTSLKLEPLSSLGLCFAHLQKEEAGREGLVSSAGRAWKAGVCTRRLSFI